MSTEYDPLASVQAAGPPGTISFVYGLPDPATFPADDLRRAADAVLREQAELALQYGPQQGWGPLIDYVRGRLARTEGLVVERPQILLTAGSSAAIDPLCTLYTRPGDRVLVEAPTYHETVQLLRDHGLSVSQVPIDAEGLRVDALAERLEQLARRRERVRFLYVIPNFQNPSGVTLAAERRGPVLELAERHDFLVVEDDVYRDLAYEGEVPPSLYELDGGRRTVRIGSFSKILAPGVRMGWLLGPPAMVEGMTDSGLRCMGGGPNPLVACILATYCRRGLLEPHVERLQTLYRERRNRLLAALEAEMPAGCEWTRPRGGSFVWLALPEPLRAAEVVARARQRGLWLLAGDPFFAEAPTGQYLRLAFSYVPPDQIEAGIRTLGEVIAEGLGRAKRAGGRRR